MAEIVTVSTDTTGHEGVPPPDLPTDVTVTETGTVTVTGTTDADYGYSNDSSTHEPEDPGVNILQLVLPVLLPFAFGGLCFLYRYLYVSRHIRLARRPGDSDPPSTSGSSQGEGDVGAGAGAAGAGGGGGGLSSGLAFTVAGVAGASFAPVCGSASSSGLGLGASIFAWQHEPTVYGFGGHPSSNCKGSSKIGGGGDAAVDAGGSVLGGVGGVLGGVGGVLGGVGGVGGGGGGGGGSSGNNTNYQIAFAQYCTADSFSNFASEYKNKG